MFKIELTESALDDLRFLEKYEQTLILDVIEQQLSGDPLTPTRNRKQLRPNELSAWELRVRKYRVFYDIDVDQRVAKVKAIGWKEHNKLFIRGKEFTL